MIHTWFNSMDTQLFLTAPLLTLLLLRKPKIGWSILVVIVLFSICGTALQIFKQDLPPVPLFHIDSIDFLHALRHYMSDLYFLPMQHASAFVIGCGTALFIFNHGANLKMRKDIVISAWVASFAIKFGLLFTVYPWNSGISSPTTLVSTLYGSTCRTIWALTHCWDFIAGATGNGGFLEHIFGWKPVIPLARLSFTAHTFGVIIMHATSATTRSPYFFTHYHMVCRRFRVKF